jgi:hypothetical protein
MQVDHSVLGRIDLPHIDVDPVGLEVVFNVLIFVSPIRLYFDLWLFYVGVGLGQDPRYSVIAFPRLKAHY